MCEWCTYFVFIDLSLSRVHLLIVRCWSVLVLFLFLLVCGRWFVVVGRLSIDWFARLTIPRLERCPPLCGTAAHGGRTRRQARWHGGCAGWRMLAALVGWVAGCMACARALTAAGWRLVGWWLRMAWRRLAAGGAAQRASQSLQNAYHEGRRT